MPGPLAADVSKVNPREIHGGRGGLVGDPMPADQTPAQVAASLDPGSLLEALPDSALLVRPDGRILYANLRVESLTGFTRQELTGKAVQLLVASDLLDRDAGTQIESICRRADGGQVPVTVGVGRLSHDGLVLVTLRDATSERDDHEARFEAEAKYRSLVEQIPGVVYLDPVDENSDSIYVSPQVQALLGVTPEEWLGSPTSWSSHLHPEDFALAWEGYLRSYNGHIPLEQEYRVVREDGAVRWVLELANPIDDEQGRPWLIQGVLLDITQRRLAEERAAYLAYHDLLTGLPNRTQFETLLEAATAEAVRIGSTLAVAVLDLDNFGFVNESLGYLAGDGLIGQLADRLRDVMPTGGIVARQGGDKFLLLLPGMEQHAGPHDDDAERVALDWIESTIRQALHEPFDLEGIELVVSVSTGLALLSPGSTDPQSLLQNADTAMHQAKKHGSGGIALYTRSVEDPKLKLQTIARLRHAVQHQHWLLMYQPVVDLRDGSVTGVEALIRWQDESGTIIPPGEFIPLAEELGLIETIGDWVIHEVAAQQARWKADGLDLMAGFNLSLRQFRVAGLAEKILGELHGAGVDPRSIVLEVTESVAMADPDRTHAILGSLHAAGLEMAIDDFGTGYSSLSRLRQMPVDILKIDQSFIRNVDTDLGLAGMVRAMIQFAQSLNMSSLAEGIETPGELAFLRANGCRLGQGFLMSRPVLPSEIPALVRRPGGLLP
jgi:diguanylate cyclase (GGDEF)-like protein/PAS domain S-box-containing protein